MLATIAEVFSFILFSYVQKSMCVK